MATKGVMRIAYSRQTLTELRAQNNANNDESINNLNQIDATTAPAQRILLQDVISANHHNNHNHNHAITTTALTAASPNEVDNVFHTDTVARTAVHHARRSGSRLNFNLNLNLNQRFRAQTTPPPSTAASASIFTPAATVSATTPIVINTSNNTNVNTTALSRVSASLRRAVSASAASFSSTSTSVADIKFASATVNATPSPPPSSSQSPRHQQQMIFDFNLNPLDEQLDDSAIENIYSNISTFTADADNYTSIHIFDHVQVYRAVLALDASSDAAINSISAAITAASTPTPTAKSPVPTPTAPIADPHLAPILAIDVFNKNNNNSSTAHQTNRPLGRNRAAFLSLCSMNLVHLSPNVGFFAKNIVDLELCCNNLYILPPEIGHLRNLIKLNVSRNKLQTLPTTIAYCTKLRNLECTDNNIFFLPNSIGNLTNLHTLNLSRNTDTLTHLPQQIGLCVNLQELVLSENIRVQYLPVELFRLKKLHRLVLEGCDGLLGDEALDDFANEIEIQIYNTPTLKELAARALYRNQQSKILKHMQPHLKTYLRSGKVAVCSFCAGPIFEYEIERWRRIVNDGNILIGQERLCWRHWDTEQERIIEMFNVRAWTAPRSTAEDGGSALIEQRPFTLLARKSSLALNNFAAAAATRLSIDHYRAAPPSSLNSNPNAATVLSQSLPIMELEGHQSSTSISDQPNLSPTGSERSSFLSSLSSFRKSFQLSQQPSALSLNLRNTNRQLSVRNRAATSLDFSSDNQHDQHEQQSPSPHQTFFQLMLPVDSVNHHVLSHRYYAENNDFDDYDDNESMFEFVSLHQNDGGVGSGDDGGVGGILPALVNRQAVTIAQIKAMRQLHFRLLQQIQQQNQGGRNRSESYIAGDSGGLRPTQRVALFFGAQ
ncbi:hypothetical protein HK100_001200 [Physocladia obscura]|uniref:Uncharacterized protein n=1 Tax=Physocladia obscura TaxID=109957 RepID=A0AAD5T9B2_9FUNG|nr:hypothetical protein HK100_001200 [Physocladia obscura]